MFKFKVGDSVRITAGKDKSREGKVEKVFTSKTELLIPGVNIYKKHVKGASGQKGGIYDIPRPLSVAKLALVCPKCKKITRVGFKFVGSAKVRFCKKCGKEIDK